ncbi:iron(III) transport system substrate-binding protein [Paracoccus halophilus]|uniref:Iron(III) transport system substrate-binding protein n=1 Tax=Paracoccus halophilus TaxID=376733 RepID=A0A099F6B6_9RHOB|nr:putative 2-aminoethylphosphonate ABC transporter substrate-binding protein [Paracoccus halophilus]KGJ05652.1 phosphonate ABC transporter substrate-binding protein [Paracoccus halophilus]SFA47705.1 iron(III) transport system substrate-binding protein [Paracoccus halophilus]
MNPMRICLAALIAAGIAPAAQAQQTTLTVYTAFEAEDLQRYKEAFEAENPDISIEWVRDSTGIITAKLLAEKDNPVADAIWGLAASSLLLMKSEGMLEPYAPKGVEALDARFVDTSQPPAWIGLDAWIAALCVNTIELEKTGAPVPASWEDLTRPEYEGMVAMPNPASSGTGFLDVSAWLQMFGEEKGWDYMDRLHKNIAFYTHSGSKPCKDAARGEVPIGVSFAFRGAKSISEGAPLAVVMPSEGSGWDMEAAAIVAGTDFPEEAQRLMDWTVSENAMKQYNVGYAVVATPGIAQPVENYPEGALDAMIENDFEWAANNREQILKEWSARYDSKSEAQ